jgi:hypothetical protein
MNENTSEGPLTATVGERLAGKGSLEHAAEHAAAGAGRRPAARRGAVRVPWGALLAAAAGWWLATSVARGVRRGLRRGVRRGVRRRLLRRRLLRR